MAISKGFSSAAALKTESNATYGNTPIAMGTFTMIHIVSENITANTGNSGGGYKDNTPSLIAYDPVIKAYRGDIICQPNYSGFEYIYALALGFHSPINDPQDDGGTEKRHLYIADRDIEKRVWQFYEKDSDLGNKIRRGTLCIDKGVSIWEYLSAMITKLSIKIKPKSMRIIPSFIAHSLNKNSSVNSSSSAWSIKKPERITFKDLTFWIRARDQYIVTTSNDTLIFRGDEPIETVTLTPGTYTGSALAREIATQMTATLTRSYTCTYNKETKHFKIRQTEQNLLYVLDISLGDSGESANFIGFSADGTGNSANNYTIESDMRAFCVDLPITDTDKVTISEANITLDNSLVITQDAGSGVYISEPYRGGYKVVSFDFTIPRYEADTFIDNADDGEVLISALGFVGSEFDGATSRNYRLKIILPELHVVNHSASTDKFGIVQEKFNCISTKPLKEPVGQLELNTDDGTNDGKELEDHIWINTSPSAIEAGDVAINCYADYKGVLYCGTSNTNVFYMNKADMIWTDTSWASLEGSVRVMIIYNNVLYVGHDDKVGTFDGTTWTPAFYAVPSGGTVRCATVFKGRLYIGTDDEDKANIYRLDTDQADFSEVFSDATGNLKTAKGFASINTNATNNDDYLVCVCDKPASDIITTIRSDTGDNGDWSVLANPVLKNRAEDLINYGNRLYMATSHDDYGQIYISIDHGSNWTADYTSTKEEINALIEYNGYLYAGIGHPSGINARVKRYQGYDGDTYIESPIIFDQRKIKSYFNYRGILLCGTRDSGTVYARVPTSEINIWSQNEWDVTPLV